MRIGLVDVDGHNYPNLALMKISAWHKSKGHEVMFADLFHTFDVVYKSKVFTWTEDDPFCYDADEIQKGGTGYGDYTKVLPEEIEHMMPDYSLYGIDHAMGFTTRGCIRHCPFCLVHDKEGMLHAHADIQEFLGDKKKVVLLDNNIVASRHGIRQLEYCRDNGIAVDCDQGMDARILCKSETLCNLVADIPPFGTKGIRIACDLEDEIEPCHKTIQAILARNPKASFVVYCILTDDYEDSVRRVLEWRKYGHRVAVYAPPYRDFDNPRQVIPRWQRDLSRWASNHYVYYSCNWEDYGRLQNKRKREDEIVRPWYAVELFSEEVVNG